MLPEKVTAEFRQCELHRDVPGQRHPEHDGCEETPPTPADHGSIAGEPTINAQWWQQKGDSNGSFRQNTESAGRARQDPPAALKAKGLDGKKACQQGDRHPEGEHTVEHEQPAGAEESGRQQQRERAPKSRALANQAPAQPVGGEHASLHGECRHQACRPHLDAKHLIRQHHRPVKERRLVEVRLALERRHQPIAAGQHLARNLGVAALIRFKEMEVHPREQQDAREDNENGERLPAPGRIALDGSSKENALPEKRQPTERRLGKKGFASRLPAQPKLADVGRLAQERKIDNGRFKIGDRHPCFSSPVGQAAWPADAPWQARRLPHETETLPKEELRCQRGPAVLEFVAYRVVFSCPVWASETR